MKSPHPISFPVVGAAYTVRGLAFSLTLEHGVPLDLVPEPTNEFDKYAIRVQWDKIHLGYVPNKGFSCKHCFTASDPYQTECLNCGAPFIDMEKGGLAYRLINCQVLEKPFACVVEKVDRSNERTPLFAKLFF